MAVARAASYGTSDPSVSVYWRLPCLQDAGSYDEYLKWGEARRQYGGSPGIYDHACGCFLLFGRAADVCGNLPGD